MKVSHKNCWVTIGPPSVAGLTLKQEQFVQARAVRLSWCGRLHRMPEEGLVKKVYKWKPVSIWPQERPKNRWDDDIRNDMKKLKIKNLISCIQDRNKWKSYVEKVKAFKDWRCSAWRTRRRQSERLWRNEKGWRAFSVSNDVVWPLVSVQIYCSWS